MNYQGGQNPGGYGAQQPGYGQQQVKLRLIDLSVVVDGLKVELIS